MFISNGFSLRPQTLYFHLEQVLTGEDWNTILYDGIIAYQVAQKWPFTVERRLSSENQRGRHLETLESVAEWYTDSGIDTVALEIDSAKTLPLTDCSGPDHFKGMPELEKKKFLESKNKKCIDLSNADLSGGTESGLTEHIVIIQFQHCRKYRAEKECATTDEFNSLFQDTKITLEMWHNYATFGNAEKQIGLTKTPTLQVDTAQNGMQNVKGEIKLSLN